MDRTFGHTVGRFTLITITVSCSFTCSRPRDGVSLLPIIHGARTFQRPPMGFWHRTAPGIRTPAAEWMAELLEAQQAGGDLEPHPASQMAAKLPNPPHPMDSFPGHAAWIEGGWKLHRIERGEGPLAWELYDLKADPLELQDLAKQMPKKLAELTALWEKESRRLARQAKEQ